MKINFSCRSLYRHSPRNVHSLLLALLPTLFFFPRERTQKTHKNITSPCPEAHQQQQEREEGETFLVDRSKAKVFSFFFLFLSPRFELSQPFVNTFGSTEVSVCEESLEGVRVGGADKESGSERALKAKAL
jgi:hypothetical protein